MDTHSPRKPWKALIASLATPGLGQFYNGQINRGILIYLSFIFSALILMAIIALYIPSILVLPLIILMMILSIIIWIYSIIDAVKQSRQLPNYRIKPWQQLSSYLCAIIIGIGCLTLSTQYVREHFIASFWIPSSSMSPTLMVGDILFADKRYNCPGCKHHAQRGDIAIFVYPNNRSFHYIKRIIALPGDQVVIDEHAISVNGVALAQREIAEDGDRVVFEESGEKQYQTIWNTGKDSPHLSLTIPAGSAFVLGDNRSASNDSRQFGTVPMTDIVGKARQIWFSKGSSGVRWERLGKVLQ